MEELTPQKKEEVSKSVYSNNDAEILKINDMSDYIKLNMLGFQNFRTKNFKFAKQNYSECVELAIKLGDELKHAESLTNLSISHYFCGKFAECLDNLEGANRITSRFYEKPDQRSNVNQIHLRILCNLCLTCLALNKTKEALNYNLNALEVVQNENNIETKAGLLKELVYIYFRIENLQKYYENGLNTNFEENVNLTENKGDAKEGTNLKKDPQVVISKTLFYIHKFLRDNDYASWTKILDEDFTYFKDNSNIPGYIFALLNQTVIVYMQQGKIESAKSQLSNIIKSLKINGKLKTPEKILIEWKAKIETAMEIYRKILSVEEEITSEYNNSSQEFNNKDKTNSNRVLMKIILKHAINFVENNDEINKNDRSSDIKNQLEIALKLIQLEDIDLSSIDIFSIDSEITKSLKNLFLNLSLIKKKHTLIKFFKIFMKKTLNYSNIKEYREFYNENTRYKPLNLYKQKCLNIISTGDSFVKINYTSSGKKEHYYEVSLAEKILKIYEKQGAKSFNKMSFLDEITIIKYGVKTKNLIKKYNDFKSNDLCQPWLFLSILSPKRSIDLFLKEENKVVDWVFGLNYYIKTNNLKVKMISNSGFVVKKLKLKLLQKLKDLVDKERSDSGTTPEVVHQMKKYLKNNQLGLDFLSFSKVLLIYIKLKNIRL